MEIFDIIKNQYFSVKNLEFILDIVVSRKFNVNKKIHDNSFIIMNSIYNDFMNNILNNKTIVNIDSIDKILVLLNKLTIDKIIYNISNKLNKPDNLIEFKELKELKELKEPKESKEPKELKEIKEHKEIKEPKELIKIREPKETNINYMHFFSSDNDNNYTFDLIEKKKIILKELNLYNNFCNITECNNTIEFTENSLKLRINIPIGNYNLLELLNCIQLKINEKSKNEYTLSLVKGKISIKCEKYFSMKFIENTNDIPLKCLLGFLNHEYINNNSYSSDTLAILNIYDNIYIKVNNANYHKCKNFSYFNKISINSQDTFNSIISIKTNTVINNIESLTFEFYYRHTTHNIFYKISSNIIFDFIIEI